MSVTILQHSKETKHPLNSVRIAKLGLRNVNVVTVSDVNFGARFVIRLLESDGILYSNQTQKGSNLGGTKGEVHPAHDSNSTFAAERHLSAEEPFIFATIGKHGVINDLESKWKPQTEAPEMPNFDQFLGSQMAADALAKGFIVKKLQKQKLKESINLEEYEEFELVVPPGSVLLFPSDTAVGIDDLQAMNIGVKNLIVLDGTWAKAKRVYKENPWLRLLPHLKLVMDTLSLFREVRRQPKAACLSSIESIVYALKAVGENPEGLDNLLDVLDSMVGDQRRCKDERLLQLDH